MAKGDYLGEFEQLILLALVRQREHAYGMTIRQEIQQCTNRDVSIGAVYATLDRLEGKGFVSSRNGEATPERGGRAKRYFKLEAPGAKALEQSRALLDRMWHGLDLDWAGV